MNIPPQSECLDNWAVPLYSLNDFQECVLGSVNCVHGQECVLGSVNCVHGQERATLQEHSTGSQNTQSLPSTGKQ